MQIKFIMISFHDDYLDALGVKSSSIYIYICLVI